MARVSSVNGEVVYLSWDPGVSHVADDTHSSALRHPNKENKSKEKEYGRHSGRAVTIGKRFPVEHYKGNMVPVVHYIGNRVPVEHYIGNRVPVEHYIGNRVPVVHYIGNERV